MQTPLEPDGLQSLRMSNFSFCLVLKIHSRSPACSPTPRLSKKSGGTRALVTSFSNQNLTSREWKSAVTEGPVLAGTIGEGGQRRVGCGFSCPPPTHAGSIPVFFIVSSQWMARLSSTQTHLPDCFQPGRVCEDQRSAASLLFYALRESGRCFPPRVKYCSLTADESVT